MLQWFIIVLRHASFVDQIQSLVSLVTCFLDTTSDDQAICLLLRLISDPYIKVSVKFELVRGIMNYVYELDSQVLKCIDNVAMCYGSDFEPLPMYIVKQAHILATHIRDVTKMDLQDLFDASKMCIIPSNDWNTTMQEWQYPHHKSLCENMTLVRSGAMALQLLRITTNMYFAWSIPCKNAIDIILRYLRPGQRVLDIGAGRGLWSSILSSRGFEVVAFEPSFNNNNKHDNVYIQKHTTSTTYFPITYASHKEIEFQCKNQSCAALLFGWIPPEQSSVFANYLNGFQGSVVIILDDTKSNHCRGQLFNDSLEFFSRCHPYSCITPIVHFPSFPVYLTLLCKMNSTIENELIVR